MKIFWEDFFVYIVIWIWKGLICLSRFCLNARRKEEESLEVRLKKARIWIGAHFTTAMQNDWLELGLEIGIKILFTLIDWHQNHIYCINCFLPYAVQGDTLNIEESQFLSITDTYCISTGFYTCIMYCQWRQILSKHQVNYLGNFLTFLLVCITF